MILHVLEGVFVGVDDDELVFVDLHLSADEEVDGVIVGGQGGVESDDALRSYLDDATPLKELAADDAWTRRR